MQYGEEVDVADWFSGFCTVFKVEDILQADEKSSPPKKQKRGRARGSKTVHQVNATSSRSDECLEQGRQEAINCLLFVTRVLLVLANNAIHENLTCIWGKSLLLQFSERVDCSSSCHCPHQVSGLQTMLIKCWKPFIDCSWDPAKLNRMLTPPVYVLSSSHLFKKYCCLIYRMCLLCSCCFACCDAFEALTLSCLSCSYTRSSFPRYWAPSKVSSWTPFLQSDCFQDKKEFVPPPRKAAGKSANCSAKQNSARTGGHEEEDADKASSLALAEAVKEQHYTSSLEELVSRFTQATNELQLMGIVRGGARKRKGNMAQRMVWATHIESVAKTWPLGKFWLTAFNRQPEKNPFGLVVLSDSGSLHNSIELVPSETKATILMIMSVESNIPQEVGVVIACPYRIHKQAQGPLESKLLASEEPV